MDTMIANQMRHRTNGYSVPILDIRARSSKAFICDPLDPNPDADPFMLLVIESCMDHNDPLLCRLASAKLAEKPRFKALSYMWRCEVMDKIIFLDRVGFYIR
ncbi:hypothetical protein OCU04_013099 [Sclerotinia nivalis]|uniref:Uncharacterized protein n=1 Tax=Sclerotinia nivalis TaxID=352851 RepID=A0A9X0DEJ5_9HELO|nr:hypothetical protein OCU04_013099 [Sclerotinia nivalis]